MLSPESLIVGYEPVNALDHVDYLIFKRKHTLVAMTFVPVKRDDLGESLKSAREIWVDCWIAVSANFIKWAVSTNARLGAITAETALI